MKNIFTFGILVVTGIFLSKFSLAQTNTFPSTGAAGIGTLTPNSSSLLDITSTTKGVLIPRMTKTQRDAIVSPVNGLLIYQTNSTAGLYYYDGSWKAVSKGPNKSLSNLTAPTAVNVELLPESNGTLNLGSASLRWNNGFINTLTFNDATSQTTAFVPYTPGTGISIVSNTISAVGLWSTTGNAGMTSLNFVGTTDAHDLIFKANNIEGMRLTNSTQRFGVGTSSPSAKLHVNSAAGEDGLRVQIDGLTKLWVTNNGGVSVGALITGPANGLYVDSAIGIGISVPHAKLHIKGGKEASLTTGGFFIMGDTASANVVMDNNEIQARDNSANTTLLLNPAGGLVKAGFTTNDAMGIGSAEQLIDGGSNLLTCNSTFAPSTDNTRGLGNSTNRWVDVWAVDGSINTSDARDKNNIKDLDYGLKEIMKLRPVTFNWIARPQGGTKIGLIAQELQQVLPEVVRDYDWKVTDETTGKIEKVPSVRLGVMYDDIIPVLVKGMQELAKQNDDLKNEVEELKSSITNGEPSTTDGYAKLKTMNSKPETILGQNIPNPFDNSTLIPFRIPKDCKDASIMITNTSTSEVMSVIPISCNEDHLSIDAGVLASGTYSYTLYVDGKMIDTKSMVIQK